jgi:hypothetical protein
MNAPTAGVSTHPAPLTSLQRAHVYVRQNGHGILTARQHRRMVKKRRRAEARGVYS